MIVADKTYKHEVDDKMSNLPFRQCLLKDLHLISDNVSTYIMIVYSINTMNTSEKLKPRRSMIRHNVQKIPHMMIFSYVYLNIVAQLFHKIG